MSPHGLRVSEPCIRSRLTRFSTTGPDWVTNGASGSMGCAHADSGSHAHALLHIVSGPVLVSIRWTQSPTHRSLTTIRQRTLQRDPHPGLPLSESPSRIEMVLALKHLWTMFV